MSEINFIAQLPYSGDPQSYYSKRPRRKKWWIEILKFLGIFAAIFVVIAGIVMGPTLYAKFSYDSGDAGQGTDLPTKVSNDLDAINNLVSFVDGKQYEDRADSIVIPKINVDAPLVYPTNSDNVTILDAIKNGVAHYPETAMPGHVGNTFLTGHSSYYWWNGGKYNNVFALLDKLETGDLVYVYYQKNKYIYRVNKSFVVRPDQVDVLNQSETPTLTLMTCTPLGTNLRRLIVTADLIGRPPVVGTDFTPFMQIPKAPTILPLY